MDKLIKISSIIKIQEEQLNRIDQMYATGQITAERALDMTTSVINMSNEVFKQALIGE